MKKNFYQLRKVLGGFALGTVLLLNVNNVALAHNMSTFSFQSKELPKPQFQNSLGTFSVDFSRQNVTREVFVDQINSYFGLDERNTFKVEKEHSDEFGNIFYNYQHYYDDIKVEGDIVFIQVKDNKVQFINGQIVVIKDLNTAVGISDDQVREAAYNYFGNKENVKEDEIETLISKVEYSDKVEIKLIRKIGLFGSMPVKSEQIYIDAQSGDFILSNRSIYHTDTPSVIATYYRGNQSITVDSYNGSFRLKDNARNIHTKNAAGWDGNGMPGGEITGNITEYTSATANFTATEMKPPVEVHWGMGKTYDYYKNVHNRNSYDGQGSIIRNYYNPPLSYFDGANAAAVDQQGIVGMMYGNGKTQIPGQGVVQAFKPVVALDVAGHEFTHLVISRTANLKYLNESGALNESFADMFGAAIEFYTNLNPNWTIGEGIINMASITPNYMRNMANPNSGPAALASQQPDTYKGTYWKTTLAPGQAGNNQNDFGGVHTNSGVGNFWFYLLSVGGSGTNDIGNAYSVTGITIQKAEKIAYKALTTFLTTTSTYLDARNATLQAAAVLYGQNSNEVTQVARAWYAVGIGTQTASNQNIEMETKLNVYPNPATGDEVTIESSLEEATTVEMYDLSGKQVMAPRTLEYRTTLNVANFATGMYILKFKSNLGQYSHKLMIK